jgi:serine/threonine protein kinase/WD40 repeat protein
MERLQQIEEIFEQALQRDPAERDAYVRKACHGDSDLRREVASLLANHQEGADSKPWAAAVAAQLIDSPVSLHAGQRLGPYEILEPIGAGGMGQVYKARDTRLKRDVAIKICAAQFSERFEREARVIASLNHPNICQLHDVGPNFLVMELVEGETLSGPLPLETALNYARQMAEALEAAHEKGIVHRDLKPGNVKITPAGVVKVLDFGLAMVAQASACDSGDPSVSSTITMSPTRAGMILGTAPYMSPEQARGVTVDKRADIWAFGCVLYEMLAGKQAFQGETTTDILAAVLKEEPDWSRIPAKAQPLLRRCLMKDRKQRLRDIGDAMPLLEGAPEPALVQRRPWPWLVAAVLAIAAVMGWWRASRSAPLPPRPLVQLNANLPPGAGIWENGNQVALSPDATRIAVSMRDAAGKYSLATRRLDQSQFAPLSGTEGAWVPFFSPDGQWIGFFVNADRKLKKIAVQGGAPVTLCDAPGFFYGASWGDDENIIAALDTAGLARIPYGGGAPTKVTERSQEKGETAHAWPQVLPGSRAVLFTVRGGGSWSDASIDVVLLKTGERKTVQRGGYFGRYLPTTNGAGRLIYVHQNSLLGAPFDLSRLAVTGPPQPLLEDVSLTGLAGSANLDFSPAPSGSGTFVYLSRTSEPVQLLFWLDSAGKTEPLQHSAPLSSLNPRFSPDGKRLAFASYTSESERRADIWVRDLDRDVVSRLTHLPGVNHHPVWTPDSANLVFESVLGAPASLYWIRADGSGEPHRLTDDGIRRVPYSLSADGKRLAYARTNAGHYEIWTAPLEGDRDHPRLGKGEVFLQTTFGINSPKFSPDGRWLAYYSNETGTSEVYVRPFPGPGGNTLISTGGGQYPIWSRNGRELFFLAPDRRIMVADCTAKGDSFVAGKPRVWSEKRLLERPYPIFDLAPDGKRFAVVLYADGTSEPMTQLTVLLNFFDDLRRHVPVGDK